MECGHEPSVEERVAMLSLGGGGGSGCDDPLAHFIVGRVESVEEIPKKEKLKALSVVISGDEDAEPVAVVTNTKYVEVGWLVALALPGAVVPAGADPEDESTMTVKKTSVGGRAANAVLCDCPALGWKGGAAGIAVNLTGVTGCKIGGVPPATKPPPAKMT